jgi:hypothetical protein
VISSQCFVRAFCRLSVDAIASGVGARCSRDMVVRRNIDAVVHQVCTELAKVCTTMADERGEPLLDAA